MSAQETKYLILFFRCMQCCNFYNHFDDHIVRVNDTHYCDVRVLHPIWIRYVCLYVCLQYSGTSATAMLWH